MGIEYKINEPVQVEQFLQVLHESTLGARRPIHDRACLKGMIQHSNLIVSAWDGGRLVGVARSVTDFHYACYLSDLAVSESHQHLGIGKRLQTLTQMQLGPHCKLILIAAPAANGYYEKLGFSNNPRCWVLDRDAELS